MDAKRRWNFRPKTIQVVLALIIAPPVAMMVYHDNGGEHWEDFLILLVLVVTAILGFLGYREGHRLSKLENSFQHIAIQTRDHDLIKMFEEFRAVRKALFKDRGNGDGPLLAVDVEAAVIDRNGMAIRAEDVVKKVFNYYEATAIGIKNEALEERMIREWWRKSYVLDWTDFAAYVKERRERDASPKLYVEYEDVVKRWATPEEAANLP